MLVLCGGLWVTVCGRGSPRPSARPGAAPLPLPSDRSASAGPAGPGTSGAGNDVLPHEPAVDRGGGRASLGDRPHDQALAPGLVAADEDAVDVGGPAARPPPRCHGRPPPRRARPRRPGARCPTKPMARSTSSHSSSNSDAGHLARRPGARPPVRISTSWPAQGPHRAGAVVDELRRRHGEDPLAALLVGGRRAQDERPQRPRVVGRAVAGGLGHDLELVHRRGALTVRRAQAVGPGVAAADDDDPFAPWR